MRGSVGSYPHPLEGMAEEKRVDPHRFAERTIRMALHNLNNDIDRVQEDIERDEQELVAKKEGLEASLVARKWLESALNLLT